MNGKKILTIILCCSLLTCLLSSCTPLSLRPKLIKIAAPNTIDSLPLHVANDLGYFYSHRVKIELIPVASEEESDHLLITGQVDAAITDLLSVILLNQDSIHAVIVRNSLIPTDQFPYYRIVSSPNNGIEHPDQLRNQFVGVSGLSIVDLVTDIILQQSGIPVNEIKTFPVPILADRYDLVITGKLPAATLPEPWASIAIHNGAKGIISDTTIPNYSGSVIAFRPDYIKKSPETVKGFLAAYEDAISAINQNKYRWNDILTKHNILPSYMIGRFTIPDFPFASVPTDKQLVEIVVWASDRTTISTDPSYESMINADFLP